GSAKLKHCQIENVDTGVKVTDATVDLYNALIYKASAGAFNIASGSLEGQHLTINDTAVVSTSGTPIIINSILADIGSGGSSYATGNAVVTAANTFMTSGSGKHYLKGGSAL